MKKTKKNTASKKKSIDSAAMEKRLAEATQAVELSRADVQVAKEKARQARKILRNAKAGAKKARKALKVIRKVARKTTAKKA